MYFIKQDNITFFDGTSAMHATILRLIPYTIARGFIYYLPITKKNPLSVINKPQLVEQQKLKLKEIYRYKGAVTDITDIKALSKNDYITTHSKGKGKGFTGVIQRHKFTTQKATHGNTKNQRKGGAIGCRHEPGRIMKGQKMAGRMGGLNVTQRGLRILDINDQYIIVKGSVAGAVNSMVKINKYEAR